MTRTAPVPLALRIVSEEPSPRFLGLTSSERNRRVMRRMTFLTEPHDAALPTLTVPPGAIITPTLAPALPPPNGTWHLVWAQDRHPIVWQGAMGTAADRPATRQLPDGAVLDVSTARARWRAAWQLLRVSGKPSDGWLSRTIHRRISRVFSYVFLQAGLTPNAATYLTFAIGVLAGWMIAQTTHATMIAGAALFWFASIADGIDGEMARLTLSESERGEQLDTFVDAATYVVAFAGVMVGWWRQGMSARGAVLAAVVTIALPAMMLWAMRFVRAATGNRVDTKLVEYGVTGAARATGAPALRVASAVFVLFRREAVSLAFFLVALVTAQRVVYPALVASGLAIILATVLAYHGEIERAIRTRVNRTAA